MGYKCWLTIANDITVFFQFPLWDTENHLQDYKDLIYYFQFPLWDTDLSNSDFNCNWNYLSIPFMGYSIIL